jgi:uncharacterized protein
MRLTRAIFPLAFGAFGAPEVRREHVSLGLGRTVRVLYASDLHLGHWWTRDVPEQLLAVCRDCCPEVILLGGDLIDHAGELDRLGECIRSLAMLAPVGAVPGNHDDRAGVTTIREVVERAGGVWLPDRSLASPLRIDGRMKPEWPAGPRLLCAHFPEVFPAAAQADYGLVLSGHLHGGQCVLANVGGRQYPACWFNHWHGLRFQEPGSTMLVSRGLADTFPFRFNCPREVILCVIT